MVEGVMGWASWNRKSSPALNALADKLYTGKPEDAQDWWGQSFYWAGLDMWKAAIEKAGSLDNTKIRDILATEHFQTVLGETWFDKGLLNKETHPGEVGQWINGVYEVGWRESSNRTVGLSQTALAGCSAQIVRNSNTKEK